ncbi:alpha/beta hydrolase [Rhodovarius crocodyli]|uniref:Alpha/beta hydrolase n=1 Tax=Rhodovarius crocodyli TaxID=1979269 RepID=A0A437MDP1_9PROT|nr:alpha/beta hydrolase [Rhodovarius crocodyli]RVT95787.1 alpha/beta hydrolase [Rhodovarius crocodyli]
MPTIVTRDGIRLFAKSWGHGRPVVLTHGWPLSADSWDDQAVVLADAGYKVIAYDRRGFGRSDQPWSGYDYDTLADDLADVLEATESQDATIVGFSMGGGEIARYMSRHNGRRMAQAGLISSVVPYLLKTDSNPDGAPPTVFEDMLKQITDDRALFFSSFFEQFYGMGVFSQPVSSETLQWSRNVAMMAGLRPTLECVKAFSKTDFRPDMASFRVPTLIVHGTGDKTVPIDPTARAAARALGPLAKLVEYEDAPHGLNVTHKKTLAHELLTFLGG